MTLLHSPNIVRDGLVLYLDAANPKSYLGSGTTWTDLSNNSNSAILTGTTFTADGGGGFTFSTDPTWVSGGYASVANSSSLSNITTFTLSFGIFSFGTQSSNGASVFHKATEGAGGFVCEPINNFIRINYWNGSAWSWWGVTAPLTHNVFSIYDVVYNGTQIKIYKDSIEVNSINTSVVWDNTNVVQIGRRRGHLQHYLYGSIFFERFYNRVLSDSEIQNNFNALRGRYVI